MNLTLLGLTGNEQKVFEALVMYGKVTSAQASAFSGVSYGVIYNVLASLETKGLVKVIPERTKLFMAESPDKLLEVLKKKKSEFLSLEKDLKELKQTYIEPKEAVVVAKGEKNFWKLIRDLPPATKTSFSLKYNFAKNPTNIGDAKRMLKRGITYRTLGRYDKETKENFEYWKRIDPNIKQINNNGVAISIRDRKECIISLINSSTIMHIKDEAFCDILSTLFENYYNTN